MSRYQQRIIINNPEKHVPDNILQQFFLAIKTADLDKIRDFAIQYKNKFNLVEKGTKGNLSDTGKTPFHIVLELDDKIADNDTKLRIMNYLGQMGAPMDLPDASDVWPIHLAATLQSEEIIDFFIKRKVEIDRKDSSNNTPLHYAIAGKLIPCPKAPKIKPLAPEQKFDKLPLNITLENTNAKLIKLLNSNKDLNDNLIHMINTIMKIPLMYADDRMTRQLETDIIHIFTETAIEPTHTEMLAQQQTKLEQLINNTFSVINDNLMHGLTRPLEISANNGGWGPQIPTGPSSSRQPDNSERIMKQERLDLRRNAENELATLKNLITNTTVTDHLVRTSIPRIINILDKKYIDQLVFSQVYGEDVAMTKMLFLLLWDYLKINYPIIFAKKIMDNFKIMDPQNNTEIFGNTNEPKYRWTGDRSGSLFEKKLKNIISDPVLNESRNKFDVLIGEVATTTENEATENEATENDCIGDGIRILFTSSNDRLAPRRFAGAIAYNIYNSNLETETMRNLLADDSFSDLKPDFGTFRKELQNQNNSWFQMLNMLISRIRPVSRPRATPDWNNIFFYGDGTFGLPRTPLPYFLSGRVGYRPNNLYHYTYDDAFKVMNAIMEYLVSDNNEGDYFSINNFPDIYRYKINDWEDYLDALADQSVNVPSRIPETLHRQSRSKLINAGRKIGEAYPEFIFLYKILVRHAQIAIRDIIINCLMDIFRRVQDDESGDPKL